MKKWNKAFLVILCFCLVLGMTACGTGNVKDNAGNTNTEQNTNQNPVEDGVDNVENAIDDGVDAVEDGVKDMTDDLTGNENMNDAAEKKAHPNQTNN